MVSKMATKVESYQVWNNLHFLQTLTSSPPPAHYFLDSHLLATKSVVWYLRIFINSHLKWSDHIKHITAKATSSLNVLRHSLYTCPTSVKEFNVLCVPYWNMLLQYGTYIHLVISSTRLEGIQRRAARWVCGSRWSPAHKCYYYYYYNHNCKTSQASMCAIYKKKIN